MDLTQVIALTGLAKTELANLYGVSRQTVHQWVTKGPREGSRTARMAEAITAALLSAARRKVLPLPAMSAVARRDRINRMVQNLQDIKPAPFAAAQ